MAENRQPSLDPERQLIINSLFSDGVEDPLSPTHSSGTESLITYCKVSEDTGGGGNSPTVDRPFGIGKTNSRVDVKIRYLLVTIVSKNGKVQKVQLHKAKKNPNDTFSIGRTWQLEQVRKIESVDNVTFVITISKPYCWSTDTQGEKDVFLSQLLKTFRKHTKKSPKLINFDNEILTEMKSPSTPTKPIIQNETDSYNVAASLQERLANANKSSSSLRSLNQRNGRSTPNLSSGAQGSDTNSVHHHAEDDELKEEELSLINVGELLNDFDWKGSGNAAALEERLLNELAALEAANIHAMVESDDRIHSVIEQIDNAITELDNMDQWLSLYTAELNSMGDDIHHIESQNRGLQVQTANQKALLSELDRLIQSITLPEQVIQILFKESMDTVQGVQNIEHVAAQIKRVLETPFDESTRQMMAIKEKLETYNLHCKNFCSRFYEYMRMMFQFQAETLISDKSRGPRHNSLTIQDHESIVENLSKYRGLSLWMKEMDPKRHLEIQSLYVISKEPIYKKETKEYLSQIRHLLSKRELVEEATYVFSAALNQSGRASLSYNYANWLTSESTKPPWEFKDGGGGKLPPEEAFDHSLQTIIPLVVNEQNFIFDFFHLKKYAETKKEDRNIEDVRMQKKFTEHMDKLFSFLPEELSSFADYGCKHDNIQVIGMIVSLEKYMHANEKIGQDYAVRMLQQVRLHCLSKFEVFINDQLKAIEETKVTSKKRKGIVVFMRIFPRFVERIEHSMSESEKLEMRSIVNRAYERIVKTMFECVEAIAKDADSPVDDKEQLNAHIMTLENMHYFYSEIRSRRINILEPFMRYAKGSYDKHMEAYAKAMVRRPFGKLLEFFEGIESLLRTNTAPEEVGFRIQFNKAALKKVISQYPGKEIKKGLDSLYKRVEKHFKEEEGGRLLQVVWHAIEEEVIRNHERFTLIINKCYPNANITLEFSMDDLLGYFSEIARSH
ncbi:exocyst complex component Sec3-domain-containing protein [Rhizophagus clarus]|uniref:Exocyst complex component Sec3-domain-containing protein n=1 Tax=Rhizophagus clarus TaxID=94130 RepID=A0A8H3QHL3_9GLOM|nr:exocyst complex component Sec3-domain-containing protein [Rhizophagus clarus]